MDKRDSRRNCLARLKSLHEDEKRRFSQTICDFISLSTDFSAARTVFAFAAMPSEPDLHSLVEKHREKRWVFPRIYDGNHLEFFQVDSFAELIPGKFGIREPDPAGRTPEKFSAADLILVPGVGFDPLSRARIGRGKGYYDRLLGKSLAFPCPPLLIGVCFSVQFSALETEEHDIPMDRLVTERGWSD